MSAELSSSPSSVALVADAHLSGPGGPAGPLVAQLAALPVQGCRRLVLMGDLFQAWVGFRSFETADVRAVVAALRDLRARGMTVEYVEGNRDFFLAGSPYADAFDRVALETSFEAGGRRPASWSGPSRAPGRPASSTRLSAGSRGPTSSIGRPSRRPRSVPTPSA